MCCDWLKPLKQRPRQPQQQQRGAQLEKEMGSFSNPLLSVFCYASMGRSPLKWRCVAGKKEQVIVCEKRCVCRERGWIENQPARLQSWGSMVALRDERCSTLLLSSLKYSWPSFCFFNLQTWNTNNTTWRAVFIGSVHCVFSLKSYACEYSSIQKVVSCNHWRFVL